MVLPRTFTDNGFQWGHHRWVRYGLREANLNTQGGYYSGRASPKCGARSTHISNSATFDSAKSISPLKFTCCSVMLMTTSGAYQARLLAWQLDVAPVLALIGMGTKIIQVSQSY